MTEYIVRPEQCSRHNLFPGVDIRTCAGENMLLSVVEFAPHSVVEWHSHPHEQMGMLLEGELVFFIDDQRVVAQPGDMWRIPGNVRHKVVAGERPCRALDVFHPVREDYL